MRVSRFIMMSRYVELQNSRWAATPASFAPHRTGIWAGVLCCKARVDSILTASKTIIIFESEHQSAAASSFFLAARCVSPVCGLQYISSIIYLSYNICIYIYLTCCHLHEGGPEQDRHDQRDARDLRCSSLLLEDDQSCLVSPGEIMVFFYVIAGIGETDIKMKS